MGLWQGLDFPIFKPTNILEKLQVVYIWQQTSFEMCVEVARMFVFEWCFSCWWYLWMTWDLHSKTNSNDLSKTSYPLSLPSQIIRYSQSDKILSFIPSFLTNKKCLLFGLKSKIPSGSLTARPWKVPKGPNNKRLTSSFATLFQGENSLLNSRAIYTYIYIYTHLFSIRIPRSQVQHTEPPKTQPWQVINCQFFSFHLVSPQRLGDDLSRIPKHTACPAMETT